MPGRANARRSFERLDVGESWKLTMDEPDHHPLAVRYVRGNRVSTGRGAARPTEEDVCVVEEVPLSIDLDGLETYVTLCTPMDRQALTLGFLFSEGIISSMADIRSLRVCQDDPDVIRVQLTDEHSLRRTPGPGQLIVSSCGACGSVDLQERIGALARVGDTLRIEASALRSVYGQLRERRRPQSLFAVRRYSSGELVEMFERCIGPAQLDVDGFFTLNAQPADLDLLPGRYRLVVRASEALRKLSATLPALRRVSDGLFIHALPRS